MQPKTMRWGGFAAAALALVATLANLFLLPWGVAPFGTAPGWRVFGYVESSYNEFAQLNPLARSYFDQTGRFLPAIVLALALTVGARSGWGRYAGGALALLGAVVAGLTAATRATWPDRMSEDAAVRWLVVAATATVAVAALVAVVLRLLGRPLFYDALPVALLLLLGLLHLYSMAALVSFPDNGFRPTLLAWSPAALYLVSALGVAVTAVGAARRERIGVGHGDTAGVLARRGV